VVQYFVGKIGTNNKNSNTLWIGPKSKKFKNRKTAKKNSQRFENLCEFLN